MLYFTTHPEAPVARICTKYDMGAYIPDLMT